MPGSRSVLPWPGTALHSLRVLIEPRREKTLKRSTRSQGTRATLYELVPALHLDLVGRSRWVSACLVTRPESTTNYLEHNGLFLAITAIFLQPSLTVWIPTTGAYPLRFTGRRLSDAAVSPYFTIWRNGNRLPDC